MLICPQNSRQTVKPTTGVPQSPGTAAICRAKVGCARLIIGKLDRLSRNAYCVRDYA
jgi:hypothetical protein